ncbi:serine/threonine protein phosphatase 1 [Roseovarius nanhaiticus]|uniref:Serine/threonine protein phosphatase 1 n=1 Tax=Roseovarius nanhaiticus TaxID=573024 RepID=A0A1N7HG93_9RHOB|nr:metallophosphoesterase [Roseovarius nanhaiticus]SEK96297.1 serine/threonine protein phosphatase 1 [Roseovarius nanhaiticus]SIS23889.1 serine/threonine protein phosphatase 1 [Roseovarius nanhaiticus]
MRNLITRAFGRKKGAESASGAEAGRTDRSGTNDIDTALIAPARPLYAIGDVHGRDDLIEPMIERIDADAAARGFDAADLIFLGDYVDRGPRSAEVLARLRGMAETMPDMVTCLGGNHERMMLDFLDDPAGRGARWLINGGIETLASYGVDGLDAKSPGKAPVEDMMEASDALARAMPDGMADWLRALPLWWQSGNMVCVHAAMNPARAPEDQKDRALIWGHQDFGAKPRQDGLWVVHGHTIVKEPLLEPGRICVDTGAYATGRLTAAALTAGACRFL